MSSTIASAPVRRGAVLLPSHFQGRTSRGVGAAGAVVPPAVTTLCLAFLDGHPLPIAILLGVALVAAAAIGHRLSTSRIELTPEGMRSWTLLSRDHLVRRADVARVVVVSLFVRDSLKTSRTLYLVDSDGETIREIGGQWWPDTVLTTVSKHFGVTAEVIAEPLTLAELRRMRLVKLAWHEQHPALAGIAAGALVAVGSLAVTIVTHAAV